MTLRRMDNVLIVVDEIEATKACFIQVGMRLELEGYIRGPEGILVVLAEQRG